MKRLDQPVVDIEEGVAEFVSWYKDYHEFQLMKYNKEEWDNLASCIKTEQISPRDVFKIFKDNPEFEEWYKKKK